MASRSIARAERIGPRGAIRIAGLFGALFLCFPLHALWRLVRARSPWPPIFLGLAARVMGVRVRVTGHPLRHHVLLAANHVSWLDILALGGTGRSAFVSKAEVRGWGIIGWLADLNNTVYVEREDRRAVKGQADALRTALERGKPVTLFPEGTTGDGTALRPFRASLFAAVAPPPKGIRVQPVALDYGPAAPEIAWSDPETAAQNARRLLNRPGHILLGIHFCKPLSDDVLADRKAIAQTAQAEIAEALNDASRARGSPIERAT